MDTFRQLTRQKKQISIEECKELLTKETRGILAVNGDGGYPYAMPMNHYYNPEDGCLYFHSGKRGHRLDALRRSDKVSFCVCEKGERPEGDWALTVRSVVVFGRMEVLEDADLLVPIATALCRKFTEDESYIQSEIEKHGKATLLLKLTPEHICGKRVTES
ncbi:MAG: pyridoxamine 5'-phosphate oxidase family protein [Clostridia bacterium]|nr:pyridoxamine 5'-phosphate oxidase family protein [Clostridia bacterium]